MALFRKRHVSANPTTLSSQSGNRLDNGTRWSDKYSGGFGGIAAARNGLPGWALVILVVLAVALVASLAFGVPAMTYRGQSEGTFINRMLPECDDALALANTLRRTGAVDSYAALGRIRASIHAVGTINEVHNTIAGSYFVQPYVFNELFSIIDSYNNNLKLGNATMQNQTDLVNGLSSLRDMLADLQ